MSVGFHTGELDVQRRAGVSADAARLVGMLRPADLDGGPARFLAQREFAVLTARDDTGALWTSPLLGPPGFLDAHGTTLDIHTAPADPLPPHQPVGLLAIEFAIRRRMRVNGTLAAVEPRRLRIDAEQAFGNCPSYIRPRSIEVVDVRPTGPAAAGTTLTPAQAALIHSADTFFLGTAHPTRGSDASHKGGTAGFVRIDGPELWWPDYAGNNMFNSMGNIAVNPEAALLFVDFATGATVQLSGQAELWWTAPGDTGRGVRFRPDKIISTSLPIRAGEGH